MVRSLLVLCANCNAWNGTWESCLGCCKFNCMCTVAHHCLDMILNIFNIYISGYFLAKAQQCCMQYHWIWYISVLYPHACENALLTKLRMNCIMIFFLLHAGTWEAIKSRWYPRMCGLGWADFKLCKLRLSCIFVYISVLESIVVVWDIVSCCGTVVCLLVAAAVHVVRYLPYVDTCMLMVMRMYLYG